MGYGVWNMGPLGHHMGTPHIRPFTWGHHTGTPHMGTHPIWGHRTGTSYGFTPNRAVRADPIRGLPTRGRPTRSARSSQPQGGASASAGNPAPRAKMAAPTALRALGVGTAGDRERGVWGQGGDSEGGGTGVWGLCGDTGWGHWGVGCGDSVGGIRGCGVWGHFGDTDGGDTGKWVMGTVVGHCW